MAGCRSESSVAERGIGSLRHAGAGLARRWRATFSSRGDALDRTIYRFILRHSRREQIFLVLLTLLSFPVLYYSLELPKVIVNQAIGGKGFPRDILGFRVEQISYLLLLCAAFLVLVVVNGLFKYYINVRKGQLGERLLRQLRFQLCDRVLRFPMPAFEHVSAGAIIAMVTAELEPLGEFIGDAFALPIFQIGTLVTIIGFMFVQDAALGAAAILLYPVQGYIIPKLQRKVRQLGRERVRMVRRLADRIGETIAGRVDIRANGAAAYQLAGISTWLDRIYRVRFDIYNRKFFAKFLNNFINQLTPFLFLAIGGYFVITGRLSLGALVAVLAAYKELSSPWKELLDFYQQQQDVAIKYEQVIEQFDVAGMLDRATAFDPAEGSWRLSGTVAVSDLTLLDADGVRRIDGVSFAFPIGEDVAILGPSDSGKSLLAQLLARLITPSAGRIAIGQASLDALPLAVTGRSIGYVGAASYLFSASLRDNLLIGLRRVSLGEAERIGKAGAGDPAAAEQDAPPGDIDLAQAGVADIEALEVRIGEVLCLVGFADETYGFGLHGRIPEARQAALVPRILTARRELHERLAAEKMTQLVERFDPERYNANATVAQNLLFGTPTAPGLEGDALARNPAILALLDRFELRRPLLRVGADVAETMVEIFTGLQDNHELVEEFSLVRAEELAEYAAIVGRLKRGRGETLPEDGAQLLALAFKLIAARHRLGLIDEELQQRILAARRALMTEPSALRDAIEFFDEGRYNAAATVQENLLLGKIALGEANARERIQAAIAGVLAALELREAIVEVGLGYQLGSGGSRLTLAQRQKVAIARAVLKRPDLLILNEATAVLDDAAQRALLAGLRRELAERSLVCCLHRIESARDFDRILVMDRGRLVGNGRYEAVNPKELIASAAAD